MGVVFVLKIALAQIPVSGDISENCAAIMRAVDFAEKNGADIVLTPEGSLSGYTPHFDRNRLKKALDDVEKYAKAKKTGMALGTCFEESDGKCYNELRFYLPDGSYLGCHTKTLCCGTIDDNPKGEINDYSVMPLRVFDYMGVCVGGLICNDLWANPGCTPQDDPHLAYRLSRMGTKIIFHAVNGGRDGSEFGNTVVRSFHSSHVIMMAGAYRITIATVDNSQPHKWCVSSQGGVADGAPGWTYTLPDKGEQFGLFTYKD